MSKFLEDTIINFLRENQGKRFSMRSIHRELVKMKISYHYLTVRQTIFRFIKHKRPEIKTENYGNIILVWYEEPKQEQEPQPSTNLPA
jgi:predicted AAA+ superfamily ATPase